MNMASPDQYRRQLKDMGLDRLEITASSIAEAKDALRQARAMEKQLRQIKRNINLDMKTIRAEYSQRMSGAAATSSGILSIFGKRKLAGQLRADAKRSLRTERDRKLQPYDAIKLTIDDLLVQLSSAKDQIQSYIEDTHAQQAEAEESARQASDNADRATQFCPQCGAKVDDSDKFCRNCGKRIAEAGL